jgi:hypothetical protein
MTSCDSDAATGSNAIPTIVRRRTGRDSWPDSGPRYQGNVASAIASYQIGVVSVDSVTSQTIPTTTISMTESGRLMATYSTSRQRLSSANSARRMASTPPRRGLYGWAAGRAGSPRKARQRSIRATSREPSIAIAMKATPMPAHRMVRPNDAIDAMIANAKTPMRDPSAIAAFAYQVAGWIAESTNARAGLRARRANANRPPDASSPGAGERSIPDGANVAPPGIRADASQEMISSSPATRTALPITFPLALVEGLSQGGRSRCRWRRLAR